MPSVVHSLNPTNHKHQSMNRVPPVRIVAAMGHGQESSAPLARPLRRSVFNNPGWPPAPDCAPPTPSGLRLARAPVADQPHPESVSSHPAVTQVQRAQQMQARALAAQAAHQQRVSAAAANPILASHVITPSQPLISSPYTIRRRSTSAADADFKFGVGFRGFDGAGFGKLTSQVEALPVNMADVTPTPALAYPSLNNPAQDLVDEMQVDKSLGIVASPNQSPRVFTSPNAPVDISAFLPAPGPPVLIANEATIVASAVPLADWAADLFWNIGARAYDATEPCYPGKWIKQVGRQSPLDLAGIASFRTFVHQTLSATLASPQGLILGIYFASRLPIGVLQSPAHLGPAASSSVLALFASLSPALSWSPLERAFRDLLHGSGTVYPGSPNPHASQLAFVLSLMLSNKWLEDNTFTTKTWHDVTGLPQAQLRDLETMALELLDFSLFVKDAHWNDLLNALRSHTSELVAREPIGEVSSVNRLALTRIDELLTMVEESEVNAAVNTMSPHRTSDKGTIRSGDDAEDVVLLGGHSPARGQSRHSRTASLPVSVHAPAPAKWDMQLDSPVNPPRREVKYEAVRPPAHGASYRYTGVPTYPPAMGFTAYPRPMYRQSLGEECYERPPHILEAQQPRATFQRPWPSSVAPQTFNAPHPARLTIARADFGCSSQFSINHGAPSAYAPPNRMSAYPNHDYGYPGEGYGIEMGQEPAWVSQIGYAAHSFVAGSTARLRT